MRGLININNFIIKNIIHEKFQPFPAHSLHCSLELRAGKFLRDSAVGSGEEHTKWGNRDHWITKIGKYLQVQPLKEVPPKEQ